MKSKLLIVILFSLMTIIFSGCGMMGMHGFHTMQHNRMNEGGTILIKEFEKNGIRSRVTVPSLMADKVACIQLLLEDENGLVSNATVDFSFDSGQGKAIETIQIVGDQDGVYAVEYEPTAAGDLKIIVEIQGLPQSEKLYVSMQQKVHPNQDNFWSGRTKYILGGLGMGVMMLWMIGSGGHWH